MTAGPTPLPPGSLTVPLWSGWGEVALAVLLVLLVGLAGVAALVAGQGSSGRPEWHAWLDGRSAGHDRAAHHGTDTPSR